MKNQLLLTLITLLLFFSQKLTAQNLAASTVQEQLQILWSPAEEDISWDLVNSYHYLVEYYLESNDFENALIYCLQAKAIGAKLGNSDYEESTRNFKYLIRLYLQKGDYEQGMETVKEGLEFTLNHPQKQTIDVVFYYLRLARTLTTLNESKRAIEHLDKALYLIENDKDHGLFIKNNDLPSLYRLLGANHFNLKDLEKANYYYNKCIGLFDQQNSKGAVKLSISNTLSIGSIYIREKQYETALRYLKQADSLLQVAQKTFAQIDFLFHELRGIRWQYGTIWMELGELDKAKKCFWEIAEKYPVEGQKWEDTGTYFNLSKLCEWDGELEKALYYNQQAILASCKTFNESSYLAIPPYDDFRELGNTYWLLNQKAQYLALLAAKEEDPLQKKQYYAIALEVVDLFDQLHIDKLKKMNSLRDGHSWSLIKTSLMNYKTGLSIAHEIFQWNAQETALEKAFYFAQKLKAQQLWLTLLKNDATRLVEVPDSLLQRERLLLADIQLYERKILEAKLNKDTAALKLYENNHLFESRRAYTALNQEIEKTYPEYHELRYNVVPESGKSLKQILKKKELLVEYVFADTVLFAFTISGNQRLTVTKVPVHKNLADRINDLNTLLQKSFWMRRTNRDKFVELSYALYQQFLQPIQGWLAGKERLIIIGDGITNYIPFEALVFSSERKTFRDLNYLIRKHEVSYHYSASLFAKARAQTQPHTSGVFTFAPVYEKAEHSTGLLASVDRGRRGHQKFRAFDEDGFFTPLPESEREVQLIANLFSQKDNLVALRDIANESNLKSNLEKSYRFIHIAGHSFADLENPNFSGIACFERTAEQQDYPLAIEDGILYAGEIYNLRIHADLVTLSSCESGYGKMEVSEGLLGLNRAFISAGTPNVVFSLWKVYDKVSAELMVDFYENILSGKTYTASLRQAKLNLLNKEMTAAPHYWAPYLLIGR